MTVKAFTFLCGLVAGSFVAFGSAVAASPFDGEWAEVIVGENAHCDVHLNTSFTVSNGHLSQAGSSGTVKPNGAAVGTANSGGYSATWSGHFSGNKAAGRFERSDGCIGRWTAVRR